MLTEFESILKSSLKVSGAKMSWSDQEFKWHEQKFATNNRNTQKALDNLQNWT